MQSSHPINLTAHSRRHFFAGLAGICILFYFVGLFHLDRLNLKMWDESTYLINAENMLAHPHVFMVYDFNGKPEMFSPKPPLYTWIAAIFVKLLPHQPELAIRLPSALFAFFTIVLIYGFCFFYLGNMTAACISALALLTSIGFFQTHVARTGDTDTTFVFWCMVCCLCFFAYTREEGRAKTRALWLSALGLLFAAFTKGPGVLILFPPLFLWLLYTRKFMDTIKRPSAWIALGSVLLLIGLWYYMRESLNPGFLKAVWKQELRGRFEVVEDQVHKSNHAIHYLYRLFDQAFFMPWLVFMFPALVFIPWKHQSVEAGLIKFITLIFALNVLSIARTASVKDWYDAAWYPLMALITGTAIAILVRHWGAQQINTLIIGLLLLASWPLSLIIKKNVNEKETSYLKPFLAGLRTNHAWSDKQLLILNRDFDPALFYHVNTDKKHGHDTQIWRNNVTALPAGTYIITMHVENDRELEQHFKMRLVQELGECKLYRLESWIQ